MTDTDRLAALLHEADCKANRLYCDGQRCEDIAARLIAQGVRVGDDGLRAALTNVAEWLEENATRIGIDLNCDMLVEARAALAAQPEADDAAE